MIPILFDSAETQFASNGIGRLIDCISCTVTEERNGIYECEFKYPVNGRYFSTLISGGIIGVIHDDTGDIQPFDIYKHSAEISGVVTFNARHISYRLCGIVVAPFTVEGCAAALEGVSTNSATANPFTFTTNKTLAKTYKNESIKSARSILLGEAGSILQAFQGEYKFDKWAISLLTSRGSDTGVTVRYGKNMTGITWERDDSNCFNAVAPFWTDGVVTVSLPEIYVQPTEPVVDNSTIGSGAESSEVNAGAADYMTLPTEAPIVCVPLDMSQMIEAQPTEAELRQAAISYLDTTKPWEPYDKITVNFVAMWQTPEYESVAAIQRISLCDTVSIYWTDMGIVAEKAKVVRTVFNVLAERYDEMQVGSVSTEFVAITSDAQTSQELTFPIQIEKGGTGATNAAAARINLELSYNSGDTESVTSYNIPLSGVVTANASTIYLDYTPTKSLENISTITATSFKGALYGVNGTIESSTTNTEWVGKSDITITCVKLSNNRIRIAIVKSSAFTNATQYTPMAAFVKFTFSFS